MGDVIPLRRRQISPAAQPQVDVAALYELACAIEQRSAELARTTYQAVLAANPAHADARVNLGRLLHEAGELTEAAEQYRAALTAQPAHATAAFNLGVLLEDQGQTVAAGHAYRTAIAADARCADAHFNLSRLLERDEPREALRHLLVYRRLIGR